MASTTTQVRKALDDITEAVVTQRFAFAKGKGMILDASAALGLVANKFAEELGEIDTYTKRDSFEVLAEDEKGLLMAELASLKAEIDALIVNF